MSSLDTIEIEDALLEDWDVIIIGSGMGGCSAAYELSKHNLKTLILEKGLANFNNLKDISSDQIDPEERLKSAKWPYKLTAVIDKRRSELWAPLGCGAGGSTSLYAAALQRLEPWDFEEQALPTGGKISWPYSYNELKPYYEQAEKLFSVSGTDNPIQANIKSNLLEPPPMCETDRELFNIFKNCGLNPYRLHVGIKYQSIYIGNSDETAPKALKQDANNTCLQPALKTGNVAFLERCHVLQLQANSKSITSVVVEIENKKHQIKSQTFILAAGAYFSPVILQNSRNETWPDGLANRSGMVGRNLMFHTGHHIAFWPKGRYSLEGENKTIAVRDYYNNKNIKYGEFQSTGLITNYGLIVFALRMLFDQSPLRHLKFLKPILRIPAFFATRFYGNATIFATIVEDYPYHENRVIADSNSESGMYFEYNRHQELIDRTIGFKNDICKKLSCLRNISMGGMHLNYGHPCGTCRMGDNPATSVFDSNGKAHDLDNLYIADGSFMPTSGGTNPSLTIAANALRVAKKIAEKMNHTQ